MERAFDRLPARAPRSAFRSGRAFENAVNAAPANWSELGPVTPNVSGIASQFFDPVDQDGPATQESGRLTAIAVDPGCTAGDCRVWVAAAGGGIWRTADALAAKPAWTPPPADLPTTAFGSIYYDEPHDTLYAGSGEPNGSSDSEAGLGLFKSTDGGASWSLVPGSAAAATNRSIGSIAVAPGDGNTIYIGVDLARHGSSSVNGGRRTPPDAPPLGLYKSTNGGTTFTRLTGLSDKTPANPTDPGEGTGSDWFQGGVNHVAIDPNDSTKIYAAVFGYGLWRSDDSGATWAQIFHTVNQTDFEDADNPGDTTGDRTEFDLVDLGTTTRAFLGDESDDLTLTPEDEGGDQARVFRNDDVGALAGDPGGDVNNARWTELSSDDPADNGYAAYGFCQTQCSYDMFVNSPPGKPDEVWLGGSMNYDELPAYAGLPPRSNGRAVIRSTDAGGAPAAIEWADMTATLASDDAWDPEAGLHPDQHAIGFSSDAAFVASDGGLARVDVGTTEDRSASCDERQYVYEEDGEPEGLRPDDLQLCKMLLTATPGDIAPLNDGLRTLQFQSLSVNPKNPAGELLGGTQDNGTWSLHRQPGVVRERRRRRRPVGLQLRQPDRALPQLLRRHAGGQLPRQRPDDVAGHLRPAAGVGRGPLVLRAVHLRPEGRRAPVHGPRARLASGEQRRRRERSVAAVPLPGARPRPRPVRQLAGHRPEPDRRLRRRARGPVRGRHGARADRHRHAVGGHAHRARVHHQERRRGGQPGAVPPPRRRQRHSGAVRERHRDRPGQSRPRDRVLLGLRRVHAADAGPRVRRRLQPGHPRVDLDRPVLRPRRPADHRRRAQRRDGRRLRVDRLRRDCAWPRARRRGSGR